MSRPAALVLALALALGGCGDEGGGDGAEATEQERLVGRWLIEDPVSPISAAFNADGSYRIEQDFNGTPFVQEGLWALPEAHTLVQTHGVEGARMRNTETFFVDDGRLVIGGVLTQRESTGAGLEGVWETVRVVEVEQGGGFALSSKVTRTLTLQAPGTGTLIDITEREGEAPTQTRSESVSWSDKGDGSFELSGGVSGVHTRLGDQLVPLDGAYLRQP